MPIKWEIVGEGTIRKHKNGLWEARLIIINRFTEERKRKSFYGKLRRDAKRKMDIYKDNLLNSSTDIESGEQYTVRDWMAIWLEVYKVNEIRPGTYEKYRLIIDNKIIPALGDRDLRDLDPPEIQAFLNSHSPTLAGKQINEIRMVLSAAYNQAVALNILDTNPVSLTTRSAEKHHEIMSMTQAEQSAFLEAARGSYFELFYRVALATGMRPGELLGLRWEDIDDAGHVIHIRQAITTIGSRLVAGEVKSQAGVRDIMIHSTLQKDLLRDNKTGLVFCTPHGTPYNPSNIRRSMTALCEKAGIPVYTIKDLRSTFATRAAEKGVNPKILMAIMGHSKVEVTLKYYTAATSEMISDAINKVVG